MPWEGRRENDRAAKRERSRARDKDETARARLALAGYLRSERIRFRSSAVEFHRESGTATVHRPRGIHRTAGLALVARVKFLSRQRYLRPRIGASLRHFCVAINPLSRYRKVNFDVSRAGENQPVLRPRSGHDFRARTVVFCDRACSSGGSQW